MVEEGHLQLKFEVGRYNRLERQLTSQPMIIHQLPWIIRVNQQERGGHLCCSVICNSESQDNRWNCVAKVALRVLSQNKLLANSECKHIFNSQENSCGYTFHMGVLMSSEYVYSQYDAQITVEAKIETEASYVPKVITSLVDRMVYLLSSGKDANVHFLVGTGEREKEQFAAHKGILATISDVFDRMFDFDSNHGNSDKVIEVTDVKPEAFRVMLNFIYTTNLGGLNQENVFYILHAAKKYDITDLVDACALYPKLDVNNVLYALGKALFYDVKDLIDRCWKFIDRNACAVLASDKFVDIDQALLCSLFARDQLRLRKGEIVIWNAALLWADAQCQKRNMEATGDNRREVLGPALFNIRFPLIPQEQFASIIVPTKVLTKDEMLSVYLYHSHPTNGVPGQYTLEFSSLKRAA